MNLQSAYYKWGAGNSVVSIVTSPWAVGRGVLIPAGHNFMHTGSGALSVVYSTVTGVVSLG